MLGLPFGQECDHCETSERAYADIVPLLTALAEKLGKQPQDLLIYDPYYCQGSTVARLASLGFPRVHNRKEDFYEVRSVKERGGEGGWACAGVFPW